MGWFASVADTPTGADMHHYFPHNFKRARNCAAAILLTWAAAAAQAAVLHGDHVDFSFDETRLSGATVTGDTFSFTPYLQAVGADSGSASMYENLFVHAHEGYWMSGLPTFNVTGQATLNGGGYATAGFMAGANFQYEFGNLSEQQFDASYATSTGPASNVLIDTSGTAPNIAHDLMPGVMVSDMFSFFYLTTYADGTGVITLDTVSFAMHAVPVPEPETYGMLLSGLGLAGILARARRKAADR